ncbi:septin-9-like isoform X1 [Chiloscyllium plagiosum]|uniref:septin-9-like isoform X1 n=3 Tax=Chiloscyllium plagiosum TaxID=36176 RepID=UPI001CB7C784|nr:septin-9-like isoform X1 [Chiloscyllium plagiosum]
MSELSVNDHLEGILSDFEALKRSFEIDDVDDGSSLSPTSPLNTPFHPAPASVLSSKVTESFVTSTPSPPSYHMRIGRSSSSIPGAGSSQNRKVTSSQSFNQGSKPLPRANGNTAVSLAYVSSFQNKTNPNGFPQSSRADFEIDRMHGSTSSLVYPSPSKSNSLLTPLQSSLRRNDSGTKANHVSSPTLKKYSSQGNVFPSVVHPSVISANVGTANHGSMPALDLHIADEDLTVENKPAFNPLLKTDAAPHSTLRSQLSQCGQVPKTRIGLKEEHITLADTLSSLRLNSISNQREQRSVPNDSFSISLRDTMNTALGSVIPADDPTARSQPRSQTSQTVTSISSSPVPLTRSKQGVSFVSVRSNVQQSGESTPSAMNVESSSQSMHEMLPIRLVTQPQLAPPHTSVPEFKTKLMQDSRPREDPVLSPQTKESPRSEMKTPPAFSKSTKVGINCLNRDYQPTASLYHDEKVEKGLPDLSFETEVNMQLKKQGLELKDVKTNMAERMQEAGVVCSGDYKKDGTGRDLFGYVGIEAVLDQMRRKAMKTGFEFNVMVVGESGLGKSTLVNTLFKSKVSRKSCTPNFTEKIPRTVELQTISHVIEEKGVKMNLTVIDTPGFGDQINNENCWEPIVKYINEQYEKYLREEININRKKRIPDTRVHCCVYFVPPTGHWLRPLDIEFMNRLDKIVNIVPVIAKADTLTLDERRDFKQRIRQDLRNYSINVYPQTEFDEDPEDKLLNDTVREKIPFAVVGTDQEHQVNGKKILGRKTKWGIIEVENGAHCEFANLRDLLIRSHLQDLKDVTHKIHYETYRVRRLNESNGISKGLPKGNNLAVKEDVENNL